MLFSCLMFYNRREKKKKKLAPCCVVFTLERVFIECLPSTAAPCGNTKVG